MPRSYAQPDRHDHEHAMSSRRGRSRRRDRDWIDRLDGMPVEWLDQLERWLEEATENVRVARQRR